MSAESPPRRRAIATLREGPLHAALKSWYREPGDGTEVPVDGLQIDLVRGDLLIEIQTCSVASIRGKLERLLPRHPVRLVHPVPAVTWIVRVGGEKRRELGRRRSPRPGRLEDAFGELVGLRGLLAHPNLSVELLVTHEEEVRELQPGRAWRRNGWVVVERRREARHPAGPGAEDGLLPPRERRDRDGRHPGKRPAVPDRGVKVERSPPPRRRERAAGDAGVVEAGRVVRERAVPLC
jgi:hypothetical protein